MTDLRIGCSGWTYDDWKGPFYPDDLRLKDRLAFYATQFDACEINGSFYRLPTEKAVKAWAEGAPDGFCFAWKVSRYISHNKKLKECEDSVKLVFGVMSNLGDRQGPALVQLPPMLKRDDERLKRFLGWLPKTPRVTVEFRHPTWYEPAVLKILEDHGAAFCISDHHDAPSPWEATSDLVYVRMHGPGGHYHGRYPRAELETLAERVRGWRRGRRDVHVYFDNDQKSAAPQDAKVLKKLTEPA
ncbi:DUF72 domain-containing protein [Caulobacter sp. 73W]|uniref:DUF72 domain-containing protein n=1 Tax=Caulobacter sp. 73W TaxID=3161137 RepID=A0AB39KPV1_9CAUL